MVLFVFFIHVCTLVTMSDILSPLDNLKVQNCINVSLDHSPHYVNKVSVDKSAVALTLQITSKYLQCMNKFSSEHGFTYIEILNSQFSFFQLVQCDRVEARFRTLCSEVINCYRKKYLGGRKRQAYDGKIHNVTIFKKELFDVQSMNFKLTNFDLEKAFLEKRCQELYKELCNQKTINSELTENLKSADENIDYLKARNQSLTNYIDNVLTTQNFSNSGKRFEELQQRQKHRKIKLLETYAEKALAFAETFGIKPLKVFCKTENGKNVTLNLSEGQDSNCNISTYSNLESEEKDLLKQVLFLLDKFCISDAAYHELSVLFDELPRKYLIVQCKEDINKIFHLERLPGNKPGVMVNFESELKRLIKFHIEQNPSESDLNKIKVKFSGDGTRVSRISNFIIFSLSVVSETTSLSFNQLNTVAIVSCKENYEDINDTCKPLFKELSKFSESKFVEVNDKVYDVELFIGGDMKFIQLLLGLGGATGDFACPWCKVHKNDRHDFSKDWNFYHSPEMFRSVEEISSLSSQSKNKFGVKHKPLLNIDVNHYIPDELHLMLRISDVLLRNIIDDVIEKDDKMKKNNEKNVHSCLENLVNLIQSCGVSFSIWYPKGSQDIDWTSLAGSEKIKLFKLLPDKLLESDVLNEDTKQKVVSLWQDFYQLYQLINRTDCNSGLELFEKVKLWLSDFLYLGDYRKGYLKKNVTPYMHCFIYHVPIFISLYGSLNKFSGQAVEKNNDIVKMIHQRKSSKWDGPTDALKVRKRLEYAQQENIERPKRQYTKQSPWWEKDIFTSRQEKRQKILCEITNANENNNTNSSSDNSVVNFEQLSDEQLRDMVSSHQGKKTRLRNRQKLIAFLKDIRK